MAWQLLSQLQSYKSHENLPLVTPQPANLSQASSQKQATSRLFWEVFVMFNSRKDSVSKKEKHSGTRVAVLTTRPPPLHPQKAPATARLIPQGRGSHQIISQRSPRAAAPGQGPASSLGNPQLCDLSQFPSPEPLDLF